MLAVRDTVPLKMLQDHPLEILQHLRDSQRAVTLTVDGKPSAVIQHPAAYQRLLDLAAFASAEEGIRQGREDAAAGRVTDVETAFKQMRAEFGIPE